MARRCLYNGFIQALNFVLLAAHLVSAPGAAAAAGTAGSSILGAPNHKVPDYVTRYAPFVWLHSEDPFRPSDLLQHVRHTMPAVDQKPIKDAPELDLDNLAVLNDMSKGQVALTSVDDPTTVPSWFYGEIPDDSGKLPNATACVVVLVEKSPADIDAFYFYFYSYDRGPNLTQVVEPLKSLLRNDTNRIHYGDHVGDWEHNMVRFRDEKPTGIYYSQHRDGASYKWSDKTLSWKDERPIVYSAYGSHANYPSPGSHIHDHVLLDYCDAGLIWDPVLSAYFYHLEPTSFSLTRLLPSGASSPTTSNLTSFIYYNGIWGDAQYQDDDPRQMTIPRFGIKRFESGPTGPLTKQLLRKGLVPDKGPYRSWIEWAVGVFMAFYPCCIRGWRVWVSAAVLLGLMVSVAFGIWYGLRRYKRRGYQKVETEIYMDDLGSGEDSADPDHVETRRR